MPSVLFFFLNVSALSCHYIKALYHKVQYYVISTYEFRVNVGNSHMFRRYRKANPPFMTNDTSVSWAANWSGGLWLRFMPAIPLPFEGGGVRNWQSYVQVLSMIGDPKVGSFPTLQFLPLQKPTQDEVGFDVKWWREGYSELICIAKKPGMYIITLNSD